MKSDAKIERTPAAYALANVIINEPFVYLEGESDIRYWKNIFQEGTHIRACDGWKKVIETVELVNQKMAQCIGVIDKDFREILPEDEKCPKNVFVSDDHDLEQMMYKTDAFRRIIRNTYTNIEENEIDKLKNNILKIICVIGYVKLAIRRKGIKFEFKKESSKKTNHAHHCFEYPKYEKALIEEKKLTLKDEIDIDVNQLITLIVNYNNAQGKETLIKTAYNEEIKQKYDPWTLGSGHDFTYILRHILLRTQSVCAELETLEEKLYLAYDKFFETELYKSIVDYCKKNTIHII